ncbi:MAG: hypothetical protein IPK17_08700 [Chloroflexi bacterium]|uniref:hypothetical protein n=1 Tax=Candidatus Flexifilum breve TaxID=3140694 RepID=UPI0031346DDD|nr:hypothetical protein [Chloroflexota bacterium]
MEDDRLQDGDYWRHDAPFGIKSYINTTGEGVVELARAMKPIPDIVFLDLQPAHDERL